MSGEFPKTCAGCPAILNGPKDIGAHAFDKDFCWECMETGRFYKHGGKTFKDATKKLKPGA